MFLPFLPANPELVERSQACENASAEPTAISTLDRVTRCVDLDAGELPRELIVQPLREAGEEASAAGDDDVCEKLLLQVGIA